MATDLPLWMDTLQYSGDILRRADSAMVMGDGTWYGSRPGVRPGTTGLTTTLSGSTISVTPGSAVLYRGGQIYRTVLTAAWSGTLNAAHATYTRIDIVYLRVWDTDVDSSGLRKGDIVYLPGTASATPAVPTPGASEIYLPLAQITVPPSGGGSASVSITVPVTVAPGGILPTSTAPTSPYKGQYWDDGTNLRRYNGSAWETYGPIPSWQSYTSTWSGLSVLGSSTSSGRYIREPNRKVTAIAELFWGTGSSLGTGTITVSLPLAAASGTGLMTWTGTGRHSPANGTAWRPLMPMIDPGGTTATVYGYRTNDSGLVSPGTAGYVWGQTGASMRIQIVYEAAS